MEANFTHRLDGKLLFAVPKKGRLQQAALELLAGSDIKFHRNDRSDIALSKNLPIALVFLPAADIPSFVGEGNGALGITGLDTMLEHESTEPPTETTGCEQILDLGFGRCKLQIQIPEKGEIQSPEQLIGKRIATSFPGLSAKYFRELESASKPNGQATNGESAITPGAGLQTKIHQMSGSVEAACSLGMAAGIVDLVESGLTMRVAGLKPIATICSSTAVLIKSKRPSDPKMVELITSRIQGVITAQRYVLCTYNVERTVLPKAEKITPGRRAPTVNSLDEEGWVAVQAMVEKGNIANIMDELKAVGAQVRN